MNDPSFIAPEGKLDAYTRVLEERLRQLLATGHLTGTHAGLSNEVEARQKILRDRVNSAIQSGRFWEIVKAELARDYRSLFDNLLGFEERLDHEFEANYARRMASRAESRKPRPDITTRR